MKATLRIPMREAYGYIELEVEVQKPEDAVTLYKEAITKSKEGDNLEDF